MKEKSDIKIEKDLILAAESIGYIMDRSPSQQLEYWAKLGQKVSDHLDPLILLQINAGLLKIKVEPTHDPIVSFDEVIEDMKKQAASGELSKSIMNGNPKYQASSENPGFLERVDPDGTVVVGQYKNGKFVAK